MSVSLPRARKRFGQHFLHDASVLDRIVASFAPRKDQIIVEIGPGRGALTERLLDHVDHVHAVEIDHDLTVHLQQQFGDHIQLHNHDVLNFDFATIAAIGAEGNHLRVIGNLPYNISTPLLFHLFEQKHIIADMLFMLQKEVVNRLAATRGTKEYGRLSVMAGYHCEIRKSFDVYPGAFTPPPKVESSMVSLIPHTISPYEAIDVNQLSAVVRQAFSQRRKTLRRIFKQQIDAPSLINIGIDGQLRPEQLSIAEFIRLTKQLFPDNNF